MTCESGKSQVSVGLLAWRALMVVAGTKRKMCVGVSRETRNCSSHLTSMRRWISSLKCSVHMHSLSAIMHIYTKRHKASLSPCESNVPSLDNASGGALFSVVVTFVNKQARTSAELFPDYPCARRLQTTVVLLLHHNSSESLFVVPRQRIRIRFPNMSIDAADLWMC